MQRHLPPWDAQDDRHATDRRLDADRRLDTALEQTFPASDPIPWIHDLGPRPSRNSGPR